MGNCKCLVSANNKDISERSGICDLLLTGQCYMI